jgi:hypothetical protein
MKDFKTSIEQREWEYALESHARAIRALQLIEDQKIFWESRKQFAENKFPQLKNIR